MIDVETIQVDVAVPRTWVPMVSMHPLITLGTREPFVWSPDTREAQLDGIRKTLEIAQNYGAKFTLFPEYSIPSIEGAVIVHEAIANENWPRGTIVIGGMDGLRRDQYSHLCRQEGTEFSDGNSPESVGDRWVNCCIIWVKESNGTLRRWIQPKLSPAWPERAVRHEDMFCGSTAYVFEAKYNEGPACRFLPLICYDWVGSKDGDGTAFELVLNRIDQRWNEGDDPKYLDWLFVIQHNDQPNHASFLNSTSRFLIGGTSWPYVNRDHAAVAHINSAGSALPVSSGAYGHSSFVFQPLAPFYHDVCRPTFCVLPDRYRDGSRILHRFKDVVFREMGACIHEFRVRVSRFVQPDAPGRIFAVDQAVVHAIRDTNDPRLPGGPVPAVVKWTNDSLDSLEKLSDEVLQGLPLEGLASHSQTRVISEWRRVPADKAERRMTYGLSGSLLGQPEVAESRRGHPDMWADEEAECLRMIVDCLSLIDIPFNIEVQDSSLHAKIDINGRHVEIVVIKGRRHTDCSSHFQEKVRPNTNDPVLVVTKDERDLIPVEQEYKTILDVGEDTSTAFLDHRSLLDIARRAADQEELRDFLHEHIPQGDPTIV